jgi:hypothetical protein
MELGCLVIIIGLNLLLGASELAENSFYVDDHEGVRTRRISVEHEDVLEK